MDVTVRNIRSLNISFRILVVVFVTGIAYKHGYFHKQLTSLFTNIETLLYNNVQHRDNHRNKLISVKM